MTSGKPIGTEERMTICHVFSGDLWAGAEVVIFNLLTSLQEDTRFRVLALALNEGLLTDRLRAAGITTFVIPESRHSFIGIAWRAARLLRHHRVTVLHSHRYKENVLAWLLARWLGVSVLVSTLHGWTETGLGEGLKSRLLRWRNRLDYLIVRKLFSTAVAVSEEMKRVLVNRLGFAESRVRVIRNGGRFPATETAKSRSTDIVHIGSVGRLVATKGFDLLLHVAHLMRRETPKVRFSILGEGPLRDELIRRAVELGVSDCVEFLPPRPDPFPYYRSLDIYVNTSLHEGVPMSVVEAMACGKPVVAAAVGGIPEIMVHGEHGYLVDGRDAARFAERCLTLMRDERLRKAMGEQAAATAHARLSAGLMTEAYGRLYEESAVATRRHESSIDCSRLILR